MKRTKIAELEKSIGTRVKVQAWLHEIRDQSKIKFMLLRDDSGIAQAIITSDKEDFEEVGRFTRESVLTIIGTVKNANITNPEVSEKTLEINVEKINVLSRADQNLPIQVVKGKEAAELNTRLDWRWLDLRKPKNLLIFKVWTKMEAAMREYWIKNGFVQIHSPKFMAAPSESGAELFSVAYFGRTAYLAQSPQFYKQMAMASGFDRVFEIGPVFRANPSHTSRHDTEFTSIDMEMSFIDSHEDVMRFEEKWIVHFLTKVKKEFGEQIMKEFDHEIIIPKTPFPRVTMEQALSLLREKGHDLKDGFDSEAERLLSEIIKEKHNHEFVFITEYPVSERPFYHMRKEEDVTLTKSFDLVWSGLEVTTGAQREHRYEILKKQAEDKGLNLELIKDYLNFFKYGCPPHGGFGIGFTRLLVKALGLINVREATLAPRDTERLRP